MKKHLILFANLFFAVSLFAQPAIQWQKTIGGNNADELSDVKQTTDG